MCTTVMRGRAFTVNRMNLVILLDRLGHLIETAPEIPLTGRSLVDADEALDIIEKVRNAIPEEVKRAEWLTNEKDRVMQEGQAEAERLVLQAEEYVARLVSESEITRQAQAEAKRILEEARQQSEEMKAGASRYADSVLTGLQDSLEKASKVVKRGREELQAQHNGVR